MKKAEIAVIGGTGFETLLEHSQKKILDTPYGKAAPVLLGEVEKRAVGFLPRHGSKHSVPPHMINYRANVYALHMLGAQRILATNAVGAINLKIRPGDIVIPKDFVDFTKMRKSTFYDQSPVTHVDVSEPYCPEVREQLSKASEEAKVKVWDDVILVCTDGPRYETPAEIRMFRSLGADVVGMTGVPEVVLARELEMCYVSVCYVSNMAAGVQGSLTVSDLSDISELTLSSVKMLLTETVKRVSSDRSCPCSSALSSARFK